MAGRYRTCGVVGRPSGTARRRRRRATVIRVIRRSLLLALLLLTAGAAAVVAEPVQQFDVQIKDVRADGRFSMVFTSNSFDTTGGPLPALADASVRFAKGVAIQPEFLKPGRLCRPGNLRSILLDTQTAGVSYEQMLSDLPRTQRRVNRRLSRESRRLLDTCRRTFLGKGRFVVDARPLFNDAIPGSLYVFLSEPGVKGAVAGFGILAFYDQDSVVARANSLIAAQQPVFTVNLFNDPTPDGRYGYRLRLLPENFGRLPFSVAELRVESKGISATSEKRTCATRRDGRLRPSTRCAGPAPSGPSSRTAPPPAGCRSRPTTATRPGCAGDVIQGSLPALQALSGAAAPTCAGAPPRAWTISRAYSIASGSRRTRVPLAQVVGDAERREHLVVVVGDPGDQHGDPAVLEVRDRVAEHAGAGGVDRRDARHAQDRRRRPARRR